MYIFSSQGFIERDFDRRVSDGCEILGALSNVDLSVAANSTYHRKTTVFFDTYKNRWDCNIQDKPSQYASRTIKSFPHGLDMRIDRQIEHTLAKNTRKV